MLTAGYDDVGTIGLGTTNAGSSLRSRAASAFSGAMGPNP
jgi:hypothetical protein